MLLAVDAGNTNVVFAVFDGDRLLGKWRLATDINRSADEYVAILKPLLEISNLLFSNIKNIIVACVVPQHLFVLKTFCRDYLRIKPLVVGENGVVIGMKVDTDNPEEVGADRLVNAVAAWALCRKPCIILDFGTATTFDVVSRKGHYIGGVIAPGVNLSLKALHQAAAKLPEIAIKKPRRTIGRSTVSAMQSGVYYGYIGLIDGIVARIRREQKNPKMMVIATGGLAPLFAGATEIIARHEPDLTINGLKIISERQ